MIKQQQVKNNTSLKVTLTFVHTKFKTLSIHELA